MKVNRKELLQKLLAVEIGINKRDGIQQSGCVFIKKGRFYTQSQEMACSMPSELDQDLEGAILIEPLINLLKSLSDEFLEINKTTTNLTLKGMGRTRISVEDILPSAVGSEVPQPNSWIPIAEDFPYAVERVRQTTTEKGEWLKSLIHINPNYLESCDDIRMTRFLVKTNVKSDILVRAKCLKCMEDLGMTRFSETENWIHFWNPLKLRFSIRKYAFEKYPNLEDFLNLRGQAITVPKSLGDVCKSVGVFTDQVKVDIKSGSVLVEGISKLGEYRRELEINYSGPDMSFLSSPQLLSDLVEEYSIFEITESSIRAETDKYILVSTLEGK